MKKVLSLVLCLALSLFLVVGCSSDDQQPAAPENAQEEQAPEDPAEVEQAPAEDADEEAAEETEAPAEEADQAEDTAAEATEENTAK